jgi:hypothetical protein
MTAAIDHQIGDLARWIGPPVTRRPAAPDLDPNDTVIHLPVH